MSRKFIENVTARTLMTFLVATFAVPVVESLILGKTVEEVVPHWGIRFAVWAPTSVLIGIVVELGWRSHERRAVRKRQALSDETEKGERDK